MDLQEYNKMPNDKEQLLSVIQDLPVMLCRHKPDGTIIVVNDLYCRLFKTTRNQMIGRKIYDFIPEENRYKIRCDLAELSADNPKIIREYEAFIDGGVRYLRWTTRVILDPSGNPEIMQAIGEDITESKKAQQERENLLEMLDAKNKELQSLVYISSHDLKTPLVNIAGFSGILIEHCRDLKALILDLDLTDGIRQKIDSLLNVDIQEDLDFILLGVKQVQSLLEGLLRISRVGTAEIQPQAIDMNQIMAELVAMVRFQTEAKQAKILVDPLPECYCDGDQIKQVFSNLLDNALKYLDPKRKGQIHISGLIQDGKAVYCVEDNGIGIEQRHHQKIFEIYHRLNPDGPEAGEGLGLVIIRRILDRYNGRVWLKSEPGKGSQFFVSLPIKENS